MGFAQLSGRIAGQHDSAGWSVSTERLAFVNEQGLAWPGGRVDLGMLPFATLPVSALQTVQRVDTPPTRWWLIENRASFEKYSKQGGLVAIHSNMEPMVLAAIASPLTMIASGYPASAAMSDCCTITL